MNAEAFRDTAARTTAQRRFGIGGRLVSAFIVIVGLSAVACVVGWVSFRRLSGEFEQIALTDVPRLAVATRLSTIGVNINTVTPALASASSLAEFQVLVRRADEHLDALSALVHDGQIAQMDGDDLPALLSELRGTFRQIETLAAPRFRFIDGMQHLNDELRWIQADFIIEAQPLIDDVSYNIARDLDTSGDAESILAENRRGEALLTALAQANLAVGLLNRLSGVAREDDIPDVAAFLGDSVDDLEQSIATLRRWPDSITVRQLAARIVEIADQQTGLPRLKRDELRVFAAMSAAVAESQQHVDILADRIRRETEMTESGVLQGARRASIAIAQGKIWLSGIALLAFLCAILVGYFYVHRNLLRRIRVLAASAADMSAGLPGLPLPRRKNDELGDLGLALNLFQQTRDELIQAAKLAALGQMAAGIAHEINQPLAALRSQAHNSRKLISTGKPDQAISNLAKIDLLVTRMSDQIRHLRKFARLPGRLGPTSLADSIDAAINLVLHRFDTEKTEIQRSVPDDPCPVLAETVRLEQVLVNLLTNALDAVSGQPARRVHVAVEPGDAWVDISVSDTGSGIAPDHLDKIFDPFFTTKPPGSGLGLGLSISFNIVKDFGGSMTVANAPEGGSVFTIRLRRAA